MSTGDQEHSATGSRPPSPAAGWYADPNGSPRQQYWDGQVWTGQFHPPASDLAPEVGKRRSINRVQIPLLVVGALVAAGALAWTLIPSDAEADIPVVEEQIGNWWQEETDQRVQVDCPSSVEWDTGGTFKCLVSTRRGEGLGVVLVTMQDDAGGLIWQME